MSKRHQASRRRTYGRRQHELRERPDRPSDSTGLFDGSDDSETGRDWIAEPAVGGAIGHWAQLQRIG